MIEKNPCSYKITYNYQTKEFPFSFQKMSLMAERTRITQALCNLTHKPKLQVVLGNWPDGIWADPIGSSVSSFSTSAVVQSPVEESPSTRLFGLVKEYEDYRRALYGGLTHKALLVDAVGTLVIPSQPVAQDH